MRIDNVQLEERLWAQENEVEDAKFKLFQAALAHEMASATVTEIGRHIHQLERAKVL